MDDRTIIKQVLNSHLSLKPEIVQSIEDFKSSHLGVNTLGVHVRYTDMKIPLDKLITKTKKINKTINLTAFSCPQILKKLLKNFKRSPKYYHHTQMVSTLRRKNAPELDQCPDRVQNGIEALMDMYLLASCNDLIFSSQSSFGLVASILSKASKQHLHDVNSSSLVEKVKAKITGIAK